MSALVQYDLVKCPIHSPGSDKSSIKQEQEGIIAVLVGHRMLAIGVSFSQSL